MARHLCDWIHIHDTFVLFIRIIEGGEVKSEHVKKQRRRRSTAQLCPTACNQSSVEKPHPVAKIQSKRSPAQNSRHKKVNPTAATRKPLVATPGYVAAST
ncbi:hypothetical protein SASPL_122907 [Salvia splendens]|uniref:Uncharacterized protein n=1 Tax=Salvia splendens TaxID=180675 RepID=A0A8X8ZSX2_SALSN|nr:hypothetical protein SASPL_122907 [Salvia splendens]